MDRRYLFKTNIDIQATKQSIYQPELKKEKNVHRCCWHCAVLRNELLTACFDCSVSISADQTLVSMISAKRRSRQEK